MAIMISIIFINAAKTEQTQIKDKTNNKLSVGYYKMTQNEYIDVTIPYHKDWCLEYYFTLRVIGTQQVLRLHLAFQTRNVPVTEVLTQLLHLLQLQQVDPQHLYGLYHLPKTKQNCIKRFALVFSAYQSVDLALVGQERLAVALLVLHERLDVQVESIARLWVGGLSRQLTSLEQERE